MTIGKKIKKLCSSSSYTQSEIALKIGVSVPTLRRIFELSEPDINVIVLQKLSKTLDVPISELIEGVQMPEAHNDNDLETLVQEIKHLREKNEELQSKVFEAQSETISILKKMMVENGEGKLEAYSEYADITDMLEDLGISVMSE